MFMKIRLIQLSFVRAMVLPLLGASCLTACGPKAPPVQDPVAPEPVIQGVVVPASAEGPVIAARRLPDQEPEAETEIKPGPFRVGALIDRGDGQVLVGLIADGSEDHHMVRVGGNFQGYHVSAVDMVRKEVYLERDGERYVVRMGPGSATQTTAPVMEPPTELTEEMVKLGSPHRFEATPDETARGIDPNDSATWPEGYRGPMIERTSEETPKFEPLPFERERGIDPNDPASWPGDYRGPGIERAIRAAE